jgi:hypothetical protein
MESKLTLQKAAASAPRTSPNQIPECGAVVSLNANWGACPFWSGNALNATRLMPLLAARVPFDTRTWMTQRSFGIVAPSDRRGTLRGADFQK